MLRFVILSVVLGYVASEKSMKCPWAMGKYPFDEPKFQGEWYLVAGMPILGSKLSRCGKFTYKNVKSNVDGTTTLHLKYDGVDGENQPVGLESISLPFFGKTDKASNTMGVWKKAGTSKWTSVYKQSVIATDYDTYAVFVACRPVFDEDSKTFSRHIFAEIWSRTRSLGQETLDVLKNVVSGYDIDPSLIQMADQTNCQ